MHFCCEFWTQFVTILLTGLAVVVLVSALVLRLISTPVPVIHRTDSEHYYYDPKTKQRIKFPDLMDSSDHDEDGNRSSVYVSVVVPAFNEEKRLPIMLDETIHYLEGRCREGSTPAPDHQVFTYEIIVVDDGSDDRTSEVALDYCHRYGSEKIRVLTLEANRGKGGAVRLGVMSSRGRLVLFADADGATKFTDFHKLEAFMWEKANSGREPIAIGSRAHLQSEAVATRSLLRTILMYGFHVGVWLLAVRTVRDTQCGFKLFGRRMARVLFSHTHCQKWAFDVELLLIAERLDTNIGEIAVNWTEIEGSKVVPFWSWLQMGKDVAIISLKYTTGACRYPSLASSSGHKSD
ncbi:unnamed protein product [Medioppia subpectinata]|uniref:dolichyl-phosphate beta-glucosyltransferase n=1 Tax=Medioppia subpectinata TaxID=1979941 RepID=A0A7R9LDS5_9ACAR|nr:unnamed protein product [Medioppia subpectinata]CAG2117978.1 unnamed protein product [Medioppia subpectinata]